jgi:small conductance mechanosensitive channel
MNWNFNVDHFASTLASLFVVYGINVLGAVVIAFAGRWVAILTDRLLKRALMQSTHADPTVGAFLSSLGYYTVLVLTFLLILQVIGIQATSLVAVAGAASLAVGLALQGTLTHMAAGVMLLLFRPFHLGDSIQVGGKSGVVRGLNIFMTEIAAGDNVQILIPNGQVWGQAITNESAYDTRRVTLVVQLAPIEVDEFVKSYKAFVDAHPKILRTPDPPGVSISNVVEKGIELSVQTWARTSDAGTVKSELIQHLIEHMVKQAEAEQAASEAQAASPPSPTSTQIAAAPQSPNT